VPGVITGPPCHWGTLIQRHGPQGWGLDARLMTLLCKKKCYCKIGWSTNLAVFSKDGYGSGRAVLLLLLLLLMMNIKNNSHYTLQLLFETFFNMMLI
jgi:hypothetical protein